MSTELFTPEVKAWLEDEKRTVRAIRKGVRNELDRIQRAVVKRNMTCDQALTFTKSEIREFFKVELAARRVSA